MTPNRPSKNAIYQKKAIRPTVQNAGFSPMLTSLLACTLKDGFCNKTAFSLLRDISPYVSSSDRAQINALLALNENTEYVLGMPKTSYTLKNCSTRAPLCETDKMLGLLRVLQKYGGQSTHRTFDPVIRAVNVQRRMRGSNGNLMQLLCEFMPQASGLGNMMQMMSMFQGMANGGGGDMMSVLSNLMPK